MLNSAPDYHDSFRAHRSPNDTRPAIDWFRAAFEGAPLPLRCFLVFGWRAVLLLRLRGSGSEDVLGWSIVENSPRSARLAAESPLMSSRLTLDLGSADVAEWSTEIWFHGVVGRWLWVLVGVVHRTIVPHVLGRAARSAQSNRGPS